jgi:ABC-type sulfate/molybdate transport systems ATPase subunit
MLLSMTSLELENGEILVLVGPGLWQNTLRLIAGLDHPDSGLIVQTDICWLETEFVPPERRGIGMVFRTMPFSSPDRFRKCCLWIAWGKTCQSPLQ